MNHIDKVRHAVVGAAAAAVTFGALLAGGADAFNAAFGGCALATVGGLMKEAYDWAHPERHTSDVWDSLATAAGGVVMVLALYFGAAVA